MASISAKNENIKLISKWSMYQHYQDPTNATKNAPYGGSLNVLVNNKEKIVPRGGMKWYGGLYGFQQPSDSGDKFGVVGEFDKFFDVTGKKIPVKVFQDTNEARLYASFDTDGFLQSWTHIGTMPGNTGKKFTFATWFDKDTDQTILVFCNGGSKVYTWSGGYANVNISGSTMTVQDSTTFFSKGFIEDIGFIGTKIVLTSPSQGIYATLSTSSAMNSSNISFTGTVPSGTNSAFVVQTITPYEPGGAGSTFSFDYCDQLYNQVYYGDFSKRRVLVSNDSNQPSSTSIPIYTLGSLESTGINDLSVTGTYTGSKDSIYKVRITHAGIDTYKFDGGFNSIDDTLLSTVGYTQTVPNTYKVILKDVTANTYTVLKNNLLTPFNVVPGGVEFDGVQLGFIEQKTNGDTWEIYVAGPDRFSVEKDNVTVVNDIPMLFNPFSIGIGDGLAVKFDEKRGHYQNDTWTFTAYREIKNAFQDFYYNVENRLPGQGYELLLDSPFFTMARQEKDMYIYCSGGHQYQVFPILSSDLKSETIRIQALKHDEQNIPKDNWLIGIFKNMLTTVTRDNTIEVIGRQSAVELPQIKVMTDLIRFDLDKYDFTGGSVKYINRTLYITAPKENLIFMWDDANKGWQPPQRMARPIGLISYINNKVIGHDYYSMDSYELFTDALDDLISDATGTGIPIEKRLVLPYNNFNERMKIKNSTMIGFEGYIKGTPDIHYTINYGINAYLKPFNSKIYPVFDIESLAPNGQGSNGTHQNGSDKDNLKRKFRSIQETPTQPFYEANIEIYSNGESEYWEIIGVGMNALNSQLNNTLLSANKPGALN